MRNLNQSPCPKVNGSPQFIKVKSYLDLHNFFRNNKCAMKNCEHFKVDFLYIYTMVLCKYRKLILPHITGQCACTKHNISMIISPHNLNNQ